MHGFADKKLKIAENTARQIGVAAVRAVPKVAFFKERT
tara:strand:- start:13962 stop:14075 length:114 start_codon:yes stop_codon:yes gene_type:complete